MNIPDSAIKDKLGLLEEWFSKPKGSIVAFSGGVDSSLVLYLARKFQGRDNVIGVISNSESLKNKDFNLAQSFCKEFDIRLIVIKTNEISDFRYSQNPVDRCFYCKDHLFHDLQKMKTEYPGFEILSGTNVDDLGDYRPGLNAAQKNMVYAPLVDCKITKEEVRTIARHFNLPNWNKPASPCLSSRIPYNQAITVAKLRQIEAAEEILNRYNFEDVRFRHFGTYGKIEVQHDVLEKLQVVREHVIRDIQALGFEHVEIDPEGLVSGKMNRVIPQYNLKKE
jgi:uncharacterized protein